MIEAYLRAVVEAARRILGAELLGAYAGGSVALGGYEPGRSDVDVALVVRDPLPPEPKAELVAALRHESLPCPARGLELVVYTLDTARSGTSEPAFELELNSGPDLPFRAAFDAGDTTEEHGRFWYAVDRSILRDQGVVLFGPPADTMFAEVRDLTRLLAASVTWHLRQEPAGADAVLGACRALVRVRDGRWVTKAAAGRALAGEPVVRASLLARLGQGPVPDPTAVREFLARVLDQIT